MPKAQLLSELVNNISLETSFKVDAVRQEHEFINHLAQQLGREIGLVQQKLVKHNDVPFDVLSITDGTEEVDLYFDVSSFFGKQKGLVLPDGTILPFESLLKGDFLNQLTDLLSKNQSNGDTQ